MRTNDKDDRELAFVCARATRRERAERERGRTPACSLKPPPTPTTSAFRFSLRFLTEPTPFDTRLRQPRHTM